jgi:hypothetical protein
VIQKATQHELNGFQTESNMTFQGVSRAAIDTLDSLIANADSEFDDKAAHAALVEKIHTLRSVR